MDNPYLEVEEAHMRPVRYVLQVRASLATGFTERSEVTRGNLARTRENIDRINNRLGWTKYRVVSR